MDEKFIALTQEWHTKGWNNRQEEVDELKAKNIQLTHALVNANAEKSKWAKDYWQQVERNAEYGAMLMSDPDSLEFKCYQKEKEIEKLKEMNQRYKGKMQEQQDQIAELKKQIGEISSYATELAEYTSYAEIIGSISHNRKVIREYCDKIFAYNRVIDAEEEKALRGVNA